jgi:hypothetical protein
MSKYDRFWAANEKAGGLVEKIRAQFGKWGEFTIESAEISLLMKRLEGVSPALFSFTHMNESTFKIYSEPNKNTPRNPNDDFDKYDVGGMQMNVGILKANLNVKFFSIGDLDLNKIIGTKGNMFNGDPIQHFRAASKYLKALGRGQIVGPKKVVLFEKLTQEQWDKLNEDVKNGRRAVAYTGPDARPFRTENWKKFGGMFKTFFEEFEK